jgi:hypothetical protein
LCLWRWTELICLRIEAVVLKKVTNFHISHRAGNFLTRTVLHDVCC